MSEGLWPRINITTGEKYTSTSYGKYLQSKHWKTFKKEVLATTNNCCIGCRSTQNLIVHHKTYERLGAELLSDVVLMCKYCHDRLHSKYNKNENLYEFTEDFIYDLKCAFILTTAKEVERVSRLNNYWSKISPHHHQFGFCDTWEPNEEVKYKSCAICRDRLLRESAIKNIETQVNDEIKSINWVTYFLKLIKSSNTSLEEEDIEFIFYNLENLLNIDITKYKCSWRFR